MANKTIGRNTRVAALLGLTILSCSIRSQILPPPKDKPTIPAQLLVREFRFEGATAFSTNELAKITAPFTNRAITSSELEDARRAVTLHYVNKGYINSGAILPDQEPTNGVVRLKIVEGALTKIEVRDNRWLTDGFIESRLRRWSQPPLNLNEVKEGLQLLRQNPNIKQINAELQPGAAPGEGVLDVRVEDQHPFRLSLEIDNHRPPSVGAEQISIHAADLNVTGHGDVLDLTYGLANSGANDGWGFSGADDMSGSYTLPLNGYNTTIGAYGSRLSTSIIEEPFTPLDIESETVSYGVVLRHPIYQTANREFSVAAAVDRRQNETLLLGEPFDFGGSGSIAGRTEVAVLRLSQEWIDRGQQHVIAFRSSFNFGVDAFHPTDNGIAGDPDAKFFAWLGQAQYVRRLFNTQNQLIFRVTGQWTSERLLALEQLSVGGANTVRGYRENQLVRDRGVVASLEFRVPVLFNKAGAGIVQLAPFADFGGAWNVHETRRPDTIGSVGVGLLINPSKHFEAQLYWGYQLREITAINDDDAQDLGLHFRVKIAAF
jgi:hemolysin activation/secretion protein